MLKVHARNSIKPNNNPKELANSLRKFKGHPIKLLKVTQDQQRMICINTNKTIFLYDFSSNKAEEIKLDSQPELLSMVPGTGHFMLAID